MKWIFYYFLSHIMATQMIPSLCIPHVDSRFSAEIISDTFNALFQTDCVKDVQLKKKQFTYPNGKVRDFHLCFISMNPSSLKTFLIVVLPTLMGVTSISSLNRMKTRILSGKFS